MCGWHLAQKVPVLHGKILRLQGDTGIHGNADIVNADLYGDIVGSLPDGILPQAAEQRSGCEAVKSFIIERDF